MTPRYDNHPGIEMLGCPHQITITARSGRSMNGYACSLSGGHCVKSACPLEKTETGRND